MNLNIPILVRAQHNRRRCRLCRETVKKGDVAMRFSASVFAGRSTYPWICSGDIHFSCWVEAVESINDVKLMEYQSAKKRRVLPLLKGSVRKQIEKELFLKKL